MKTVGIIGGIAPESTIEYYRFIIANYREQNRDGSYPSIVINSIDLKKMLDFVAANDLQSLNEYLSQEIRRLASAGADFVVMASNTPHIVFDELLRNSPIPLISIVESVCKFSKILGLKKLGLFGTRFTMQGRFYPDVFEKQEITVVAPQPDEQTYIHEKYMTELVNSLFLPATRIGLLEIASAMIDRDGIQGLILGGTELPLILRDAAGNGIPFLDTTKIHVAAIVMELLS